MASMLPDLRINWDRHEWRLDKVRISVAPRGAGLLWWIFPGVAPRAAGLTPGYYLAAPRGAELSLRLLAFPKKSLQRGPGRAERPSAPGKRSAARGQDVNNEASPERATENPYPASL